MKLVLALASTVLVTILGRVPALAAADIMAGFYGNTLVVSGDSFQAHVHYKADHTLDISGTASGKAFSAKGNWTIDDKGHLCRTYDKPVPTLPNPYCTKPTKAVKVGDAWTVTNNGGKRNLSLIAGVL